MSNAPSSSAHRLLTSLATGAAAISLICGVWVSAAYVLGFGVADSWIIYPPHITPLHWSIPLSLIVPSCWWLSRPILKTGQFTLRQVFWALLILSILLALIAPLYVKYRERPHVGMVTPQIIEAQPAP